MTREEFEEVATKPNRKEEDSSTVDGEKEVKWLHGDRLQKWEDRLDVKEEEKLFDEQSGKSFFFRRCLAELVYHSE